MARYDATAAEILVFTFKEGLLSSMAHDLKLRVTRGTVDVEGASVRAELDAASLKVVSPMRDGREVRTALPSLALGEIERNATKHVLVAAQYPVIRFESTSVTDAEVAGTLSLHGVTKSVRGVRRDEGGRKVAEFRLDQRDFAIEPFTAMMGTLRVKPEVVVRVSLP